MEGIAEELEDTATLLTAGGDHRPDAFTPTLSPWAASSLRDATVDHDVPNRLFRLVVRRLNARRRQKEKVVVSPVPRETDLPRSGPPHARVDAEPLGETHAGSDPSTGQSPSWSSARHDARCQTACGSTAGASRPSGPGTGRSVRPESGCPGSDGPSRTAPALRKPSGTCDTPKNSPIQ